MIPDRQWIGAVERAMARAAATVHSEMKRGVDSLATVVAIAPFMGVFATVFGIVFSFGGVCGERTAAMAAIADHISQAFVPIALSLFVAIPAQCCYGYLKSRVETFDMEMANASLDLINQLARYRPLT
jgi:biopolymer transport protein ExbB/TolQ